MTLSNCFEWMRQIFRNLYATGTVSEEEFGQLMNDVDEAEAEYQRKCATLTRSIAENGELRERIAQVRRIATADMGQS